MKIGLAFAAIVGLFLTVAMLVTAGWDRPPVVAEQVGYRGLAMEQVDNPRMEAALVALHQAPEAIYPWAPSDLPPAGEFYENLQVLGHLPEDQFLRLMTSITEWIVPDGDCGYCHNLENLASDEVYTKVIARQMLEMTWAINEDWGDHVGDTGVTCYTCHRGQPIPSEIWFTEEGPPQAAGFAASRQGQNIAAAAVGMTSLPYDPFTPLLGGTESIRVEPRTALPETPGVSIQETERTYALMIHMSQSLGVNCTFCHNTRAMASWEHSTPQRITAWHGIQMVRSLNEDHLLPLTSLFPDERLGPLGDVAKVNCGTCHQGINLPLLGQSMLPEFPSLAQRPEETAAMDEPADEPAADEPAADEPVEEEPAPAAE